MASTGVNNCVAGPFTPNPSIDGIWPSMILDTKRAARHLINGGAGRDGTNPNKIITAGHSAGGYTSCAAMVTRGMTNNGFGVDMTIGGGPDPAFLGSLMLGSPVDFVTARANDPTHPNYGSSVPGIPGQGIIHATIAAIKGFSWDTPAAPLSVDGMNLHELIALAGASVVKPIRYHRGGSDLTSHRPTPNGTRCGLRQHWRTIRVLPGARHPSRRPHARGLPPPMGAVGKEFAMMASNDRDISCAG